MSERGTEQTKQVVAVSSNLILKVRDHQISLLRGWWVSCVPLIAGTVDNHSANVTGFGLFLLNNNDCQMQLTLCLHHYESAKVLRHHHLKICDETLTLNCAETI